MNFAQLITFWEMKDMVVNKSVIDEFPINSWKHKGMQRLYRMKVAKPGRVQWQWADILYRETMGKIALVQADCFRLGINHSDRQSVIEIYIPNAKIKDLADEFG